MSTAVAVVFVGCLGCEGLFGGGDDDISSVTRLVEELNKGLPAMADSATRLNSVTLEGKELRYNYEMLNYTSGDLPREKLSAVLGPQIRNAACGAPKMKPLWKNGYSARYLYHGKDKRLITEVVVKPSDCGLTSIAPEG